MSFLNEYNNNEAEYEALLHAMHMAKPCRVTHLKFLEARILWLNK
jgi:ribonuclease HI